MKARKLVIRFLEKHNSEFIDKTISHLFDRWRMEICPPVEIEKEVYLVLADVRQFVRKVAIYIQSGNDSELGYFVLAQKFSVANGTICSSVLSRLIKELKSARKFECELIRNLLSLMEDLQLLTTRAVCLN